MHGTCVCCTCHITARMPTGCRARPAPTRGPIYSRVLALQLRYLKWAAGLLLVFTVVLLGAIAGLTVGIVVAVKDTKSTVSCCRNLLPLGCMYCIAVLHSEWRRRAASWGRQRAPWSSASLQHGSCPQDDS